MKESYINMLRNCHEMFQNLGAPPTSKEERYKLVTRIESMLHMTDQENFEISGIRELYIARGISALIQAESNPL
jgi:hypothetical protein